ncbi:DDE_3 domain-containing protein [Trichonephila clavipes]|nr:DDE_3 domain-containing protein [Trichonephila clavipes]
MVWAGITIGGRSDLHIIWNGILTAQRYANEILRSHIVLHIVAIGDSILLMQCNVRTHLMENFLEDETIQRMHWPAYSSDLNLIQHAWNHLDDALSEITTFAYCPGREDFTPWRLEQYSSKSH